MTTSNKNFRVKNGLEVLGVSATVDGNEVLTEASNLDALANVDTTGVVDGNTIVFNEATSTFIAGAISGGAAFEISDTAPENPEHGDVWYNSNNGGLFIRYNDGFGSYEFEEDSSTFYTDDAGRGYTLRLDLSWTRNESQNSYSVYYEYRLFATTSSFFGFAFSGVLQINNSTVWMPSGTYSVSQNSSILLANGNVSVSYPEFPTSDIPLAVTASFAAQTPQSFLPLPSTIAESEITLVDVLESSSEQWVQVGLAGPKGDTGDAGPTGETGEPGVAIQETEPEDTNVLWFDTSVDGAGIPLGGTSGQILSKIDATDFNTEWVTPYTQDDANNDISTAIANVVDSAPEVLDTLNELSSALNNDPNFASTVADALAALVPAGTVIQSARVSAPAGYLLCEGQAVSRSTYSALFDAIGTTYGVGDGSSTFNVPNLQGKVPVGKNSGTFSTLGATGGSETHTLDATQIPSHNHTGTTESSGAHTHTYNKSFNQGVSAAGGPNWGIWAGDQANTTSSNGAHTHTFTTSSVGGGQAHNNLQPYIVLNYMIKI